MAGRMSLSAGGLFNKGVLKGIKSAEKLISDIHIGSFLADLETIENVMKEKSQNNRVDACPIKNIKDIFF